MVSFSFPPHSLCHFTVANTVSGNIDYNDWFNLDHTNFIADADKIMEAFYTSCHKAGPDKCAFYVESPAAIQRRLQDLLGGLKMSPILVTAVEQPGLYMPELVTYSKVQRLISRTFYKPHFKFEELAKVFAALEDGDALAFLSMWGDIESLPGPAGLCLLNDTSPYVPMDVDYWDDAFSAIMCADGEPLDETPAELEKYADKILGIGKATGAANIHFRVVCAGRKIRSKYRFTGMSSPHDGQRSEVITNEILQGPFNATTNHPILFIGSTADNVTPLQSAYNNSAHFENSVVLVQDSYGVRNLRSTLRVSPGSFLIS